MYTGGGGMYVFDDLEKIHQKTYEKYAKLLSKNLKFFVG
jgi:hypothetical protein